jgi:UDP-glucose 4-epimerase
MKILVMGGAGFIGSNIVKKLAQNKGYQITIVDNMFRGKKDAFLNSILENKNVILIQGDFTDPKVFEQLESDYDYVYMLASVVGVKYTEEIPDELIRINTALIFNTLEWLKDSNCGKVLFTSTSEVYAGTIDEFEYDVPTSETVPLCVGDIRNPRFTYAVTKMLGESGFYQYSKIHNFECTIVRFHNVYGPRMGFKHVIPQVTQRFLDGESNFKVYGHDQTRAFNFIDDAVEGTIASMESKAANGEIIHIGDMRAEIKIEELVKYIGELLDYSGKYQSVAAPEGSVSRRCPDTTKATRLFGYEPKVHWKEGVKETVEWYINYLTEGGKVYE